MSKACIVQTNHWRGVIFWAPLWTLLGINQIAQLRQSGINCILNLHHIAIKIRQNILFIPQNNLFMLAPRLLGFSWLITFPDHLFDGPWFQLFGIINKWNNISFRFFYKQVINKSINILLQFHFTTFVLINNAIIYFYIF